MDPNSSIGLLWIIEQIILTLCFSNFHVHMNHLRILLNAGSHLKRLRRGLVFRISKELPVLIDATGSVGTARPSAKWGAPGSKSEKKVLLKVLKYTAFFFLPVSLSLCCVLLFNVVKKCWNFKLVAWFMIYLYVVQYHF